MLQKWLSIFFNREDTQTYLRLLTHIFHYRLRLTYALLAVIGTAATEASLVIFMQPLIDVGFKSQSVAAQSGLVAEARGAFTSLTQSIWFTPAKVWLVPAILVLMFCFRGVCRYLSSYELSSVSARVLNDLRAQMFDSMLLLPSKYLLQHPSAHMINRFLVDANGALSSANNVLLVLTRDTLTVILLVGLLFWLNWQMALIVAVTFPLLGILSRLYRDRVQAMAKKARSMNKDLSHTLHETYDGHKVVKMFGAQSHAKKHFDMINNQILFYAKGLARAEASKSPITEFITSLALAVIICLALWQSEKGITTVGSFMAFIIAMLQMMAPLKSVTGISVTMQKMLVSAASVFSLIDQTPEPDHGTIKMDRTTGDLRFDDVRLRYDQQEQYALDGFSLHIKSGEKIALVGRSGSGKTSLINMLPRFIEPTSGQILLDGIPLEDLELSSLRGQLSLVSQDVVLFNDTLYNNVAYGAQNANDAEIEAALRAANMWEFVMQQPEGWAINIGNNGNKLSGGQRQRVSIARAILKNAPILLLDEATSALDNESERLVQEALDHLMKGRTSIIVAHRLSTIEQADRIVVMEQGKIVEIGSHQELLLKKGAYAQLNKQTNFG